MSALPRREQPAITIRSAKAVERLKVLTRDGRSQAEVIEEALEQMPEPGKTVTDKEVSRFLEDIRALVADIPPGNYKSREEIEAEMYDENGLPI
ncbi:MAG: hypothetical protein AAF205_09720 [Pseudomonadota bacterium]